MCQALRCWKRAKLMLAQQLQKWQRLQRYPMLRVLAQLRHLIWNPLLQHLTRRPALQAHLTAHRHENQ